jgi:hypothetical protein
LGENDDLRKIHLDLLYVTPHGTNVILSPVCRMFVQECDISGGDIKEVNISCIYLPCSYICACTCGVADTIIGLTRKIPKKYHVFVEQPTVENL